MTPTARLTIRTQGHDPRGNELLADARALGITTLRRIEVADVVFFGDPLVDHDQRRKLVELLVDPIVQTADWSVPVGGVETALRIGPSDAVAEVARMALQLVGLSDIAVATGRRYEFVGAIDADQRRLLATRIIAHPFAERWSDGPLDLESSAIEPHEQWHRPTLTPDELAAIDNHFQGLGRTPTTSVVETLAAVWRARSSQHILEASIVFDDGTEIAPLGGQLRDCTAAIAAPFVLTTGGPAGGVGVVSYGTDVTLALSTSTVPPSTTRDARCASSGVDAAVAAVIAAGHRPIAATDILGFSPAGLAAASSLAGASHSGIAERHLVGSISRFNNTFGVPTVAGAVITDRAYAAAPLVQIGCIGVATMSPPPAGAQPDDRVVLISSRTRAAEGVDPIGLQSLVGVLQECSDSLHAVVDCSNRPLCVAIDEIADGVGASLDLLSLPRADSPPIDRWLDHSEALVVCAVAPSQWDEFHSACLRHGIDATIVGRFTGNQLITVNDGNQQIVEIDETLRHRDQRAQRLAAVAPSPLRHWHHTPVDDAPTDTLLGLLSHPNIASSARLLRRFDHDGQGATVVRPIVGRSTDAPADGTVIAQPADAGGIAIGIGVQPRFALLDPERMAHACVDEAIRNAIAVGGDPALLSLITNLCWRDPHHTDALGELAATVRGCCEAALRHHAPIVHTSFTHDDESQGDGSRPQFPPALVVTAVAHVPDVTRICTPQLTRSGNLLVHVGRVAVEFGGSHYAMVHDIPLASSGVVPAPDPDAPQRYRRLHAAIADSRVQSCHDVSHGGLAVTLAEMCIAGRLGANVDALPHQDPTVALFSESAGRFVCEVAPRNLRWFLDLMGDDAMVLGEVTATRVLTLPSVSLRVDELVTAFNGGAP